MEDRTFAREQNVIHGRSRGHDWDDLTKIEGVWSCVPNPRLMKSRSHIDLSCYKWREK